MDKFNLIENSWIPVRWKNSGGVQRAPLVSLQDAFVRGHEIADLDCGPHERIALTRLLVCIAHAALGAPEEPGDWDDFGDDAADRVSEYLLQVGVFSHFDLLGDGPRFLQSEVAAKGDPVPCSKLFPSLATGNNPTLLDHSGMDSQRKYSCERIALGLVAFQNFYPLYGAGYKGRGPCSDGNAIHALLVGDNLIESILSNMLDSETLENFSPGGWGRPIWESDSKESLEDTSRTCLGRMVPRHRSIKLVDDLTGFHLEKGGLQYEGWEPYREPSVTVVLNKKDERKLLPARTERAIWRDLHSITAVKIATGESAARAEAAPVLNSHLRELEEGRLKVWTGALVTDLKAKILDTVESSFSIPPNLFSEAGQMAYHAGIEHAETISQKLYGSLKSYWSCLKHESPPVVEGQKHYWHSLDQEHRVLIELAGNPDALTGKPTFGDEGAEDDWTQAVRKAALDAYQAVCPRTTPRQIQAYSEGIKPLLRNLHPKNKAKKKTDRSKIQQTEIAF